MSAVVTPLLWNVHIAISNQAENYEALTLISLCAFFSFFFFNLKLNLDLWNTLDGVRGGISTQFLSLMSAFQWEQLHQLDAPWRHLVVLSVGPPNSICRDNDKIPAAAAAAAALYHPVLLGSFAACTVSFLLRCRGGMGGGGVMCNTLCPSKLDSAPALISARVPLANPLELWMFSWDTNSSHTHTHTHTLANCD